MASASLAVPLWVGPGQRDCRDAQGRWSGRRASMGIASRRGVHGVHRQGRVVASGSRLTRGYLAVAQAGGGEKSLGGSVRHPWWWVTSQVRYFHC